MEIPCTLWHPGTKIIDQLVPKWTKTGGPPSGRDMILKHQELVTFGLAGERSQAYCYSRQS